MFVFGENEEDDELYFDSHEEGQDAFLEGQLEEDCPYAKNTIEYDGWVTGWTMAKDLDEEEKEEEGNEDYDYDEDVE